MDTKAFLADRQTKTKKCSKYRL